MIKYPKLYSIYLRGTIEFECPVACLLRSLGARKVRERKAWCLGIPLGFRVLDLGIPTQCCYVTGVWGYGLFRKAL